MFKCCSRRCRLLCGDLLSVITDSDHELHSNRDSPKCRRPYAPPPPPHMPIYTNVYIVLAQSSRIFSPHLLRFRQHSTTQHTFVHVRLRQDISLLASPYRAMSAVHNARRNNPSSIMPVEEKKQNDHHTNQPTNRRGSYLIQV